MTRRKPSDEEEEEDEERESDRTTAAVAVAVVVVALLSLETVGRFCRLLFELVAALLPLVLGTRNGDSRST